MRFSLRTLLAATAVVALVCCVFFALPNWLTATVLILSAFLIPVMAVSTAVYARGYWRAFGVGSAVALSCWPLITGYFIFTIVYSGASSSDFSEILAYATQASGVGDITGMKISFAIIYALAALAGMTSVVVRWLAVRSQARATRDELATVAESEPSPLDRYEVIADRITRTQGEPGSIQDPLSESV